MPRHLGALVSWWYEKSQGSAKFSGTELTSGRTRSTVVRLPRRRVVVLLAVCAGFLRTQQRVKSQCIDICTTPVMAGSSSEEGLLTVYSHGCSVAGWLVFLVRACARAGCWSFNGEFDPGSGRTLAACLTHASRADRPFRGYSSGERVSIT